MGKLFEVRVGFTKLDDAVKLARRLDSDGVAGVVVDNGDGYGVNRCDTCGAVTCYPDELRDAGCVACDGDAGGES